MREKILVVIPYLASAAQGDELSLAIDGWHKHFTEPHTIVVVGDYHPATLRDYVQFIHCPRIEPMEGQYTPHLDHVHKFRMVRDAFPNSKGFIYTCDDIYAMADFCLEDVLAPKFPEIATKWLDEKDWDKKSIDWWSDRGKTAELCRKENLPVRDWVCHLPVYYEWDKLLAIYDKYDCDHNSYVVENIYFNMFPPTREPIDAREYRDAVHTTNPTLRPIGSVKWIYNANSGWSERLEALLKEHYAV